MEMDSIEVYSLYIHKFKKNTVTYVQYIKCINIFTAIQVLLELPALIKVECKKGVIPSVRR